MNQRIIITMLFLLASLAGRKALAQSPKTNPLLENTFWQSNPPVSQLKELIKNGNSPLQMSSRRFDPVATAILANAPLQDIKYLINASGNKIDRKTHDGRTYLFWAAVKKNLPLVKYLVNQGANINAIDDHGMTTMLFIAAKGETNLQFYDFLINHGANLRILNNEGANVLLMLIPKLTDPSLIDYFESKGLSIQSKDHDGNNAFFYAAKGANMKMMKELVKRNVNYKQQNKSGENAILYACKGGRGFSLTLDAIKFMISKGIEFNTVSNNGKTPLINLAFQCKDPAIFKFFIAKGVNPNAIDTDGNNALIIASAKNSINVIEYLEEETTDINHTNNEGQSALMLAVAQNSLDVVAFLTSKGANVNLTDKKGNSLVTYIAKSAENQKEFNWKKSTSNNKIQKNHLEKGQPTHQPFRGQSHQENSGHQSEHHGVIEHAHTDKYSEDSYSALETKINLLVQKGLNLRKIQSGGNTLIHLATEMGNKELIKEAVVARVPVNKKNNEGNTALHIAAMKAKDLGILKTLVHFGADISIKTNFGETAYELAIENEALKSKVDSLNFLK